MSRQNERDAFVAFVGSDPCFDELQAFCMRTDAQKYGRLSPVRFAEIIVDLLKSRAEMMAMRLYDGDTNQDDNAQAHRVVVQMYVMFTDKERERLSVLPMLSAEATAIHHEAWERAEKRAAAVVRDNAQEGYTNAGPWPGSDREHTMIQPAPKEAKRYVCKGCGRHPDEMNLSEDKTRHAVCLNDEQVDFCGPVVELPEGGGGDGK